MKVSEIGVECDENGKSTVSVWVKCRSVKDCDDIIAWLELAKQMVKKWEKIRQRSLTPPANKD